MIENNKSKMPWIFCVRQGGISPEVGLQSQRSEREFKVLTHLASDP